MKRTVIPELLDTDSGTPAEIAASLTDLSRINQWFGGVRTTQALIERVAGRMGRRSLSLLEGAAGSGYVPETVSKRLKTSGVSLEVTLLDRAASHIHNGQRAVAGDVLALPFADASFDLVSSCLFIHHLPPPDLLQSVNEGLRVCRIAVLINDVVRNPLHLGLVYAGYPLYRGRLTRHDAPASVRQAYTLKEMKQMLRQTTAARVEIRSHYLFRMGVIAWKS